MMRSLVIRGVGLSSVFICTEDDDHHGPRYEVEVRKLGSEEVLGDLGGEVGGVWVWFWRRR